MFVRPQIETGNVQSRGGYYKADLCAILEEFPFWLQMRLSFKETFALEHGRAVKARLSGQTEVSIKSAANV